MNSMDNYFAFVLPVLTSDPEHTTITIGKRRAPGPPWRVSIPRSFDDLNAAVAASPPDLPGITTEHLVFAAGKYVRYTVTFPPGHIACTIDVRAVDDDSTELVIDDPKEHSFALIPESAGRRAYDFMGYNYIVPYVLARLFKQGELDKITSTTTSTQRGHSRDKTDKPGRPGLKEENYEAYIEWLALTQEAEEIYKKNPSIGWRTAARTVQWPAGDEDAAIKRLKYYRGLLEKEDPETLADVAELRRKKRR